MSNQKIEYTGQGWLHYKQCKTHLRFWFIIVLSTFVVFVFLSSSLAEIVDDGFNPSIKSKWNGGWVDAIAIQTDGKIIVGGRFNEVGGEARNGIARLNPDGTLDKTFNPGANSRVYALAIKTDGRIMVGGNFTHINNQERNYFARLDQDWPLL